MDRIRLWTVGFHPPFKHKCQGKVSTRPPVIRAQTVIGAQVDALGEKPFCGPKALCSETVRKMTVTTAGDFLQ